MKKFLNSAGLTIIIFVALFAFTPSVSLAQARGNCTFPAGGTASGYTKEQCDDAGGTWVQTSPASTELCTQGGLGYVICKTHQLLNSIVPVLIALGVVYFVWGVVQYVIGDSEEAKKKGRDRIIYGIVGLAVIVGLWGLVNLVVTTFKLGGGSVPTLTPIAGGTGSVCTQEGLGKIICNVNQLLNSIIPVLIALGVVYFVWGVVQYVIGGGEEAKKKGRDRIIYGIIGLAVIVGLWGLVNLVVTTFNLGGASAPTLQPLTGTSSTCSLAGSPKFQDLLCYLTRIINDSVIPLIFALATAFFIWGAVKFFIINSDEEAKRAQGKQFMIWGIIALAVMLSVWGLVGILGATFGLDTSVLPQVKPK